MGSSRTSDVGPVWSDVSRWARQIELTHRGRVQIRLGVSLVQPGQLVGECMFSRVRGRNDWYSICIIEFRYPGRKQATMPGVLLATLNALDRMVADIDARPISSYQQEQAELPFPPEPSE